MKAIIAIFYALLTTAQAYAQVAGFEPLGWADYNSMQEDQVVISGRTLTIEGDSLFVGTQEGIFFQDLKEGRWQHYALEGVPIRQLAKDKNNILFTQLDNMVEKVYRSTDYGRTYTMCMPSERDERARSDIFLNITQDPSEPAAIYMGASYIGGNRYSWHYSGDMGASWTALSPTNESDASEINLEGIPSFSVSEGGRGCAFWRVSGFDMVFSKVYYTNDNFSTVRLLSPGIASRQPSEVYTVGFCPDDKGLLLVGTDKGVFLTDDDGENWELTLEANLNVFNFPSLAPIIFDETHPGVVFTLVFNPGKQTSSTSLYMSTDYGRHWTALISDNPDIGCAGLVISEGTLYLAASKEVYRQRIETLLTNVNSPYHPDIPLSNQIFDLHGRRLEVLPPKGVFVCNRKAVIR